MLISAIVGLDTRITMDLDTTLRRLALTEEKVKETVNEICSIDLDDDVSFLKRGRCSTQRCLKKL